MQDRQVFLILLVYQLHGYDTLHILHQIWMVYAIVFSCEMQLILLFLHS